VFTKSGTGPCPEPDESTPHLTATVLLLPLSVGYALFVKVSDVQISESHAHFPLLGTFQRMRPSPKPCVTSRDTLRQSAQPHHQTVGLHGVGTGIETQSNFVPISPALR